MRTHEGLIAKVIRAMRAAAGRKRLTAGEWLKLADKHPDLRAAFANVVLNYHAVAIGRWLRRHIAETADGLQLCVYEDKHKKTFRSWIEAPTDAEDIKREIAAQLAKTERGKKREAARERREVREAAKREKAAAEKAAAVAELQKVHAALIYCRDTYGETRARHVLVKVGKVYKLTDLSPRRYARVIAACHEPQQDMPAPVSPAVAEARRVTNPEQPAPVSAEPLAPGLQPRVPSWQRRGLAEKPTKAPAPTIQTCHSEKRALAAALRPPLPKRNNDDWNI